MILACHGGRCMPRGRLDQAAERAAKKVKRASEDRAAKAERKRKNKEKNRKQVDSPPRSAPPLP